jgi:ABC-2 type transport system ATP-binding protein
MNFFAEAYWLTDAQERQARIRELLEFFALWERRNDKVATFSKGMKQKLAIARATVHKPAVLFLDEPTSSLDPESAKEIRDLMETLSHHEKRTILLCTHRLEDAEKLCSRVVIMNKGRSIVIGTPDELREKISGQPVIQIALTTINHKIIDAVKKHSQVKEVRVDEQAYSLLITVEDARAAAPEIVRNIVNANGMILSVNVLKPSLEEAYLKLVKEDPK